MTFRSTLRHARAVVACSLVLAPHLGAQERLPAAPAGPSPLPGFLAAGAAAQRALEADAIARPQASIAREKRATSALVTRRAHGTGARRTSNHSRLGSAASSSAAARR